MACERGSCQRRHKLGSLASWSSVIAISSPAQCPHSHTHTTAELSSPALSDLSEQAPKALYRLICQWLNGWSSDTGPCAVKVFIEATWVSACTQSHTHTRWQRERHTHTETHTHTHTHTQLVDPVDSCTVDLLPHVDCVQPGGLEHSPERSEDKTGYS